MIIEKQKEQKNVIVKKKYIVFYVVFSILIGNFLTIENFDFFGYFLHSFILSLITYEIIICFISKRYFKKNKKTENEKRASSLLRILFIFLGVYWFSISMVYFVVVSSSECVASEPDHFRVNMLTGSCEYTFNYSNCSGDEPWYYKDGCSNDKILKTAKDSTYNLNARIEECNKYCLTGETQLTYGTYGEDLLQIEKYCYRYQDEFGVVMDIDCDLVTSCEKIKCKN